LHIVVFSTATLWLILKNKCNRSLQNEKKERSSLSFKEDQLMGMYLFQPVFIPDGKQFDFLEDSSLFCFLCPCS